MGVVRKNPNNTTWYSSATMPPPTHELKLSVLPILCNRALSAGTAWSSTVCKSHCFNSPVPLTLTMYLSDMILINKHWWHFPSLSETRNKVIFYAPKIDNLFLVEVYVPDWIARLCIPNPLNIIIFILLNFRIKTKKLDKYYLKNWLFETWVPMTSNPSR